MLADFQHADRPWARHLIMFLRSWGMDIAVRLTEYMGARTLPTEASMNGVIFGSTGQLHQLRQF